MSLGMEPVEGGIENTGKKKNSLFFHSATTECLLLWVEEFW
jgi:hypothetical protein